MNCVCLLVNHKPKIISSLWRNSTRSTQNVRPIKQRLLPSEHEEGSWKTKLKLKREITINIFFTVFKRLKRPNNNSTLSASVLDLATPIFNNSWCTKVLDEARQNHFEVKRSFRRLQYNFTSAAHSICALFIGSNIYVWREWKVWRLRFINFAGPIYEHKICRMICLDRLEFLPKDLIGSWGVYCFWSLRMWEPARKVMACSFPRILSAIS